MTHREGYVQWQANDRYCSIAVIQIFRNQHVIVNGCRVPFLITPLQMLE